MSVDRPAMSRRVYELPLDLHERVKRFAADRGLTEVEGARSLLREALSLNESGLAFEARVLPALAEGTRQPSDVLSEATLHHGIVALDIGASEITLRHRDGHTFSIPKLVARS